MGGILLEYESGLSSQEVGASFSIKLHTIEENPPGPPYGKVRPTEDRGLIQGRRAFGRGKGWNIQQHRSRSCPKSHTCSMQRANWIPSFKQGHVYSSSQLIKWDSNTQNHLDGSEVCALIGPPPRQTAASRWFRDFSRRDHILRGTVPWGPLPPTIVAIAPPAPKFRKQVPLVFLLLNNNNSLLFLFILLSSLTPVPYPH